MTLVSREVIGKVHCNVLVWLIPWVCILIYAIRQELVLISEQAFLFFPAGEWVFVRLQILHLLRLLIVIGLFLDSLLYLRNIDGDVLVLV